MSASVQPGYEKFDIVERVLGPITKRNPKQVIFLAQLLDRFTQAGDWAKFVLYGGAGGGGKSYILRWGALLFAMYAFQVFGLKYVRVGLFCEDYPALRDRQLSRMRVEFPPFLGQMKDDRELGLVWLLPEELGSGFITPRNLDKPEKYHSVEYAAQFIDEFTQNKNAGEIFDELRFRLRWPGFPGDFVFPMLAASNPGGPGHQVAKDLWIDKVLPPELDPKFFKFIQAFAHENPYNPPKYYTDLLTLPEQLRKAYAFGDWDVFKGQYFTEWRRAVHVCKRFKIPQYWQRFTAEDWGFQAPWCRLWFAVSPEGRVIAYREQYVTGKLPEWMAKEGNRLSEGENIKYRVGDPAMWEEAGASHGRSGPSIAEQLQTNGWNIQKADNQRVAGWQHTRHFLSYERDEQGQITRWPMLQVMDGTCPNLIRTLPSLIHDQTNPEDVDTNGEDHAGDTLRYGLMSRPRPTVVPIEEMSDEYAEAELRAQHERKGGQKPEGWA